MKVYPDKLAANLGQKPAPIYLVHGEEPLTRMHCCDLVRQKVKEAGFVEREVFVANQDTDWLDLQASLASLSLFADKRLIELRMISGKTGRKGAEILKDYARNTAEDLVLLIDSGRLDSSQTSSAWFKAIDAAGVCTPVYPVPAAEMPGWLNRRLRSEGLHVESEAVLLLAERVEGNLLAADQEVKRLAMLYPGGQIGMTEVLAAVADSARYKVQDLAESALSGDPARTRHVLKGLQAEGAAPVLLLWTLSQDIRAGTRIAQSVAVGLPLAGAIKSARVWRSREPLIRKAVARLTESDWLRLTQLGARADRLAKGQEHGDIWQLLAELSLYLATGHSIIKSPEE